MMPQWRLTQLARGAEMENTRRQRRSPLSKTDKFLLQIQRGALKRILKTGQRLGASGLEASKSISRGCVPSAENRARSLSARIYTQQAAPRLQGGSSGCLSSVSCARIMPESNPKSLA